MALDIKPIGYNLQRNLAEKGYLSNVVAPSNIPSPRGKQMEINRIETRYSWRDPTSMAL